MQEMLNFRYMGSAVVRCVRAYNKYKGRDGIYAQFMRKYWKFRHLLMSIVTASEFDADATVGERVLLPHPNGVVVHPRAVIGDDCMIMQQVTIGQRGTRGAPVIGSRVYIGDGAKILGNVVIGDGARIGANSVVLVDVPANFTAVGIPARLIPPTADHKVMHEIETADAE